MKLWLVTTSNCEGHSLIDASIHSTPEKALTAWNILRLSLLAEAEESSADLPQLYEPSVTALHETDPAKIDNYPHDTPVIHEFELNGPSESQRVVAAARRPGILWMVLYLMVLSY